MKSIHMRESLVPQVHMDVTRPLVFHKTTCGMCSVSHLLLPSSMAATDQLLDLSLQQDTMHLYHIHTKEEAPGMFPKIYKEI